jgi:chemotaxis protein methyltransferase CheR
MATVVENPGIPAKVEIHPDNYKFLQEYIYKESGIVIERDKHYLLEARLLPVAKKRELHSINDLCGLLRATAGAELRQQVVEAMTTHETLFYRDPGQFEALRKVVLPPLLELRKTSRRLTIWSAAASSGQEAYSLAMLLLEMGLKDWNISILGTDLSEQILGRAREGRFSQLEVNRGLPVTHLVKYFTRQGLDWQLKEEVRRMVSFRTFDLRKSMRTLGPFDIVFCRNVLIYFDQNTKRQILDEIRGTLQSGGYLLLGGAETTLCLAEKFERIQAHGSVLYKVR